MNFKRLANFSICLNYEATLHDDKRCIRYYISSFAEMFGYWQVRFVPKVGLLVAKFATKRGFSSSNVLFFRCVALNKVNHIVRVTVHVSANRLTEVRFCARHNVSGKHLTADLTKGFFTWFTSGWC